MQALRLAVTICNYKIITNFSNMKIDYLQTPLKFNIIVSFRQLYERAFPADERRDFDLLLDIFAKSDGKFKVLVVKDDDGAFAGFLTFWEWDDFVYGEHFAVEEAMRGRKIGEQVLRHFIALTSKPVVIEVEPPVAGDITEKRVRFYERNGGVMHADYRYIQPPYSPDRHSLELKLMTFGEPVSEAMLDKMVARIHREVYGVK